MTSFYPCSTNILSEIELLMVPNRSIRAELYKLNLYTGAGSHFNSRVDTPCSGDMFGRLNKNTNISLMKTTKSSVAGRTTDSTEIKLSTSLIKYYQILLLIYPNFIIIVLMVNALS